MLRRNIGRLLLLVLWAAGPVGAQQQAILAGLSGE
jgi:hypothetical protein